MPKDVKVTLTVEEGNSLFVTAVLFKPPKKYGDKAEFTIPEMSIAAQEVHLLYKELKARSPIALRPERRLVFGPVASWDEFKHENESGFRLVRPDTEVEIRLSEDAMSGLVWCLVYRLHPTSEGFNNIGSCHLAWSIAEKAKKVKAVKEFIGLEGAPRRRWADDDESSDAQSEKQESESKGKISG